MSNLNVSANVLLGSKPFIKVANRLINQIQIILGQRHGRDIYRDVVKIFAYTYKVDKVDFFYQSCASFARNLKLIL